MFLNNLWYSLAAGITILLPVILPAQQTSGQPYLIVLGIAQDAGFPQSGCQKACCAEAWQENSLRRMVCSLALVDPQSGERWIFDATPDFPDQLQLLGNISGQFQLPDGIFLTHAHIGHYTGLMFLGREVMGAENMPVYALDRMRGFLATNGPWQQLIALNNILLQEMENQQPVRLNERLSVTPVAVPHRDEFSETAGFIIDGPQKRVLFIPDIDKWEKWDQSIAEVISTVDIAYIDGTFFANGEIPGRDMSEIPHPFIEESLQKFSELSAFHRQKIRFIHFNHTNPALQSGSIAQKTIVEAGCNIAAEGEVFSLSAE